MKHFTRIHGNHARALWLKGQSISLCPCNLSPEAFGNAFIVTLQASDEPRALDDFKRLINEFNYYNCVSSETGYKPAYYQEV
jgi:hypothetical protein